MCGRFNITSDPLAQFLMRVLGIRYHGQDNMNLAPTETVPIVRLDIDGEPEVVPMRWWLTPYWAKELTSKYSTFNARVESAAKSPVFKGPYQKRRCVVPVSGFYEWSRQAQQKLPYFIKDAHEDGLLLAGLWDSWHNAQADEELLSFTILTTSAHQAMQAIHHRQPVFLSIEEAKLWLDMETSTADLEYLFTSRLPVDLTAIPVSSHVNNARNKDPRCAHPLGQGLPLTNH